MSAEAELRVELCDLGASMYSRGLTAGSSGNLSARLADDTWLATPTGVSVGRLDPAALSRLDAAGRLLGGHEPTKEVPLHAAMYAARPQERAVVHLHSHWSVAVSLLPGLDPDDALPPLTAYQVMKVGRLALLPYYPPGGTAAADAIRALGRAPRAVLLARHGPVVAGSSPTAAADAVEELEAAARLFHTVREAGVHPLTQAEIDELSNRFGAIW